MITLTLLHPIQSTPVQSWPFEHEPIIRIGRSSDNHVILYSAVVSRHHVELRQNGPKWEIVSLGANGTYLSGKQISQVEVVDGVVIRLARSGPSIQIHLSVVSSGAITSSSSNGAETPSDQTKPKTSDATLAEGSVVAALIPFPAPTASLPPVPTIIPKAAPEPVVQEDTIGEKRRIQSPALEPLFDIQTGQPLQVLRTVRDYQVVKNLSQDGTGLEQVVWRSGQSLLMRSLNPTWQHHPAAQEQFRHQSERLVGLRHPGLPQFIESFEVDGQPYLVREWLHGQSLSQRVEAQGSLSPDQAIAALLQLCDVLDYLHRQSPPMPHQNLHPDNLIQRGGAEGKLAVTGFVSLNTLAANVQPAPASFHAPEQQQGWVFPTSDLFAVGTVLIYLLTGKSPKRFYTQEDQGFRFHSETIPGLPPKLVSIVQKLTDPRPEDRYASAQAVTAALRQI